jgi:hypothetical protein
VYNNVKHDGVFVLVHFILFPNKNTWLLVVYWTRSIRFSICVICSTVCIKEDFKEDNGLYCMFLSMQVWEGYELSGYPTVAAPMWPV